MVPVVPDHRHVPKKLYDTGLFDLKSHDGHAAFTDAVIATLNGIDPNWRHLKKRPGQTHVHRHAEDAALYLLPDNQARAVDFVGGAGGPNPQPGWIVDSHPYTHADAHDPDDHGIGTAAPPPPPPHEHPGREEMMQAGVWLDGYYRSAEGLQRKEGLSKNGVPDWEGVGAWLFGVYFMARVDRRTPDQARAAVVAAIRQTDEWQSKHPGERP